MYLKRMFLKKFGFIVSGWWEQPILFIKSTQLPFNMMITGKCHVAPEAESVINGCATRKRWEVVLQQNKWPVVKGGGGGRRDSRRQMEARSLKQTLIRLYGGYLAPSRPTWPPPPPCRITSPNVTFLSINFSCIPLTWLPSPILSITGPFKRPAEVLDTV